MEDNQVRRKLYYGISSAAGWSWGVSFLVTYTLIHEKGVIPFAVWAFFNSLAIPIFGVLFKKLSRLKEIMVNNLWLVYFMAIVQCFSIIINLQAMFQMGTLIGLSSSMSTLISLFAGGIFIISVIKNGYKTVLYSNVIQWLISILAIIILIFIGFSGNKEVSLRAYTDVNSIYWSLYAGILLLFSPFVDMQGWVRAIEIKKNRDFEAFGLSGIFFAIYMLLILVLSQFELSVHMGIILLFLVIMISTSTIQPNAHALNVNFKYGWIGALIACLLWPLLSKFGILTLWTYLASFRAIVVALVFMYMGYEKIRELVIFK
ncbi:hypothetical protein [Streptococcus pneumoniae]|uniref:hypothetical protein n=1 Tax=Streptococcus pneumoniae TaxID=1313 RepID=UPI000B58B952|nr:hypothetical protein [Streptococcus pneumoniae]